MPERKPFSWGRLILRQHMWWPLLLVLMGLAFIWISVALGNTSRALERDGADAMAIVTNRDTVSRRTSSGGSSTDYMITYSFTPPGGRALSRRESVGRAMFDRLSVGDEVAVRYVVHDPRVNSIQSASRRASGVWVFGVMGLVLIVLTAGLAWFVFRSKASLVRAARTGEIREAWVDDHITEGSALSRRRRGRAPPQHRFTWTDATGTQGQSEPTGNPRKLPQRGATVAVYVDPVTGRARWEGDF